MLGTDKVVKPSDAAPERATPSASGQPEGYNEAPGLQTGEMTRRQVLHAEAMMSGGEATSGGDAAGERASYDRSVGDDSSIDTDDEEDMMVPSVPASLRPR